MTFSLLPITIVPIKVFQNNDYRIRISHSLIKYWNMKLDQPLNILFGGVCLKADIEAASITKDEILLNQTVFNKLLIPCKETRLIAKYSIKKHILTLGPVIGLLTEINEIAEGAYFQTIHEFCNELHDITSNIGGFFYVFQLQDFSKGKINAYFSQNGCWKNSPAPLPDVIYNRIHSRRLEGSNKFQKFKDEICAQNIPIFNDRFLSKEEVHQFLFSEEYMLPHLPETSLVTDTQSVCKMLGKYKSVFLKPIHGSQGRNIIRISSNDEKILAEVSTGSPFIFENHAQLSKWLKPILLKRSYLVQQAIQLMSYKDKQLDFRILCHRNFQNSWRTTSSVARISAEEQFVSNIARGGRQMKPLHVLSHLSDRKSAIQQLALMKELAVETSSIISKHAEGLVGELGIDIGVDKNGKLWIIEANMKPSKNFEEHDKKIRPSAKALIEYCTFLSFSRGNE